tara:strand:- start:14 stop:817 length:804 start_codon:yes stop_codon:yes gene_type:complete
MFSWQRSFIQRIQNIKPKSIFFSGNGENLSPAVEGLLKSTLSSELGINLNENQPISEIASPNFLLLSKPEDKKSIPIEAIRTAKDFLLLKTNKKKYLYIDEGKDIRLDGYNALLKIAEESDESVNIWITTSSLTSIPITILSRFQKVKFPVPTDEEIEILLKEREIECSKSSQKFILQNPKVLENDDFPELIKTFNSSIKAKDIFKIETKDVPLLVDYLIFLSKDDLPLKVKESHKRIGILLDVKKSLSLPNNLSFDVIKLRINSCL